MPWGGSNPLGSTKIHAGYHPGALTKRWTIAMDEYITEAAHVNADKQATVASAVLTPPRSATIVAPWGPWSPDLLDLVELRCQLRSVSSFIAAYRGAADPLINVLRDAELDRDVLQHAAVQFDQLPTLVARRIVSTFCAVNYRRRGR
jgi:hypothetical protein